MRDFTLSMYEKLLEAYQEAGYRSLQYQESVQPGQHVQRSVVLRHDVDKRPENSLAVARAEAALGMRGTFYFRVLPRSFDPAHVEKIAEFGHEIGFHYESLALCRGHRERALDNFQEGLKQLRKYYPVKTICMHGSPLSKWDNRDLWTDVSYKDFGIIAEPYLDTDFANVFYLSDTGRGWNHTQVAVRDKINCSFNIPVRVTSDVIELLRRDQFPERVMQTIHPQRWVESTSAWARELVLQKMKNVVKSWFYSRAPRTEKQTPPRRRSAADRAVVDMSVVVQRDRAADVVRDDMAGTLNAAEQRSG